MTIGRFERMVGIPEDEYLHLKSLQRLNDPLQTKFTTLSNEYRTQGLIDDTQARVQRQGETLSEMIDIKDELRRRVKEMTPKPYQSRAQSLFTFVSNKFKVNEKGEIQGSEGNIIEGSNITDLIQHAVRDRRRNIVPKGWDRFVNVLRDHNAPRMVLNYETLDEMQGLSGKPKGSMVKAPIGIKASQIPIRPHSKFPIKDIRIKKEKRTPTKRGSESYWLPLPDAKSPKAARIRKKPDYFNPGKKATMAKYI